MSDEVRVYPIDYGPDRNLMLRYIDPLSGKPVSKSSGTRIRKEAAKAAAKWEAELTRTGKYAPPSKTSWLDFTLQVTEGLTDLSPKTRALIGTAFATVERLLPGVKRLADLDSAKLAGLADRLRQEKKSEATVRCYLAHLRMAFTWAVERAMLPRLPEFPKHKRTKKAKAVGMKGRPITAEEFDRLLEAVPKVVGEATAEPWRFLLRGLWWSGLRLGEALALSWEASKGMSVDLSGKRPMIQIRGDAQKSGRTQSHPMAPEFFELLDTVPECDRRGRVFKLVGKDGKPAGGRLEWVSHTITWIGRAARVKVAEAKHASAHDLRRSFGFRWSRRVLPTILRELMRHADIATTMRYYIGQDAQSTAETVWAAFGNISGNSGLNRAPEAAPRNAISP